MIFFFIAPKPFRKNNHIFSRSRASGRWLITLRMFGSVVMVAFQIAFRAEIHANDVFLFFKNYFWYQHIKTIQKVQTALNFKKKKKLKFDEKQVQPQNQTASNYTG